MTTAREDMGAVSSRIELLLSGLRSSTDDQSWAAVEELVRLLTDLYGAGLALALQIGGPEVVEQLATHELGAGLLLLHGLHPDDLPARVERAVERLRDGVKKGGGDVQLLSVAAGEVRIVLTTVAGGGSTSEALRDLVSKTVWESAPDARSVIVELTGRAPAASTPVRLGPTRLASAGAAGGGP